MQAELKKLPSVDRLLSHPVVAGLVEQHGRSAVVEAIRAELESARGGILSGQTAPAIDRLAGRVRRRLEVLLTPTLLPVINATGVIVHTNLGRALLSQRARQAMLEAASSYTNLEYDLPAGQRGSRYVHAADLLCRLTGAEAAVVVNNNAAAVILALTVLAQGREVIISRSQLVEIGGGFRIPDIMAQSGAVLVEVGTTNRTYVRDYEQAIHPDRTAMILVVHPSNYRITGFTAQPDLPELSELARRHNILLVEDLGSGTLLDTAPFGLAHEPTIQESLSAGADLVTASGDKLLGGPQAGLLLGRADIIQRLKRHPLIRALRVDKTTLAGLQATLLAYLEEKALDEIPVWQMIAASPDRLARRARKWRSALLDLPGLTPDTVRLVRTVSTVGGGSLPGQTLPTRALSIIVPHPDAVAARLRAASPPVVVRIENNSLLLDPRTVLPSQDAQLVAILRQTLAGTAGG
ncbi:MAG: L-seryl-tRNA(Sec) selenium transferase [Chloroflexi bacterium]|nr:MAG: L-seryl-tRNA(Sec) selenium transferase [Chloroflexota bacterium]